MLSIYTEHITNRLSYIVTTLFGDKIVVLNDISTFNNFNGKKINYSTHENITSDLWIKPVDLLFETTITSQQINCFVWKNYKAFYKTDGDIPFDILAASFFLLSRYEEYYSNYKKDDYGNYHHENSLACKENFLHLPIINLWLQEIEKLTGIKPIENNFSITPTYDIDIAFAYKHHPLHIQIGGLIKDLILQRGTFNERLQVLLGYKKDPYQIFNWLDEQHQKHKLLPIYFILLAQQRSEFDKNPSATNESYIELIQSLNQQSEIGIHPSYKSNCNTEKLKAEIENLQYITNKQITKSRQHFLQLQFPLSYQNLIEQGIQEDYTLGYGTHNGFRASYCFSFNWFNVEKDETTNLVIHPFCYMDANAIFEQQLNAEQALNEMKYYFETVKSVSGNFIFIMHNHFLSEQKKWQIWRKGYSNFLQFISTSSSI